ncbi:MAG: hypothetical protein IT369_07085 [Candidatus Latescibacteria bacterium]|nr:hypothetical protein [Candidatus Latescibacterota bacterium]
MNLRRVYSWLLVLLSGLAVPVPAPAAPVLTNMDLVVGTVEQAVDQALGQLETQAVARDQLLLVAPQGKHAATWLVDHLLAEGLLARGFAVTLDSTALPAGTPRLSYRILDLGLTGRANLWGGQFRRESRASLVLQLSGSAKGSPLDWQSEVAGHLVDRVPKERLPVLQDSAFDFAKIEVQRQSWGKFVEPVIVSAVLGGLIHLFFSNR